MKYRVRIGDGDRDVVLDGDSVTLNGRRVRAHLEQVPGTGTLLLTVGDDVHRVQVRRGAERGQFDLSIGGYRVHAEALDERSLAIRELAGAAARPAGPAHLVAPMPGLIVRINVAEGDQVRPGQGLVVMEAMKMENELRAAAAAVVRRILVAPGSAVEKGTMLLELES